MCVPLPPRPRPFLWTVPQILHHPQRFSKITLVMQTCLWLSPFMPTLQVRSHESWLSLYPLSRLGVAKGQSHTTDNRPDTEGQHRLTNVVISVHTFQEGPVY